MEAPRHGPRVYLPDIIVVLGLLGVFGSALADAILPLALCAAAAGMGGVEAIIVRRRARKN